MQTLDNRGLNCPEPLIRTKNALKDYKNLLSIVDNKIALENILRFAENKGLKSEWEEKDGDYHITLTGEISSKEKDDFSDYAHCASTYNQKAYLISSDEFGRGSEELGKLLLKNLIYTLTKTEKKPGHIIFVNSGVKLCAKDSPVLDDLEELKKSGTIILACGTCLDYYNLKEQFSAGQVTNMYDIADILAVSDVVSL